MSKLARTLSPLIGYHGCEREVAENVLADKAHLNSSENSYDWLGSGIYFWVESYDRAIDWARVKRTIRTPYVVGAFINPGHCLNLTDYGVNGEIKRAHTLMLNTFYIAGSELPTNNLKENDTLMVRHLDCAVINYVHQLRVAKKLPAFDSVYGFFEEGEALFEGAALKERTHVQLAIRNTDSILGYFRPKQLTNLE